MELLLVLFWHRFIYIDGFNRCNHYNQGYFVSKSTVWLLINKVSLSLAPVSPVCLPVVQVQPDLDELNVNMEDNEDAESTKSEVKLGKLQFSLDYDFQKGEVCVIS